MLVFTADCPYGCTVTPLMVSVGSAVTDAYATPPTLRLTMLPSETPNDTRPLSSFTLEADSVALGAVRLSFGQFDFELAESACKTGFASEEMPDSTEIRGEAIDARPKIGLVASALLATSCV